MTGTDEHHPYVDNNAYTNYSVYRVLSETLKLLEEYGSALDRVKKKSVSGRKRKSLPGCRKNFTCPWIRRQE